MRMRGLTFDESTSVYARGGNEFMVPPHKGEAGGFTEHTL